MTYTMRYLALALAMMLVLAGCGNDAGDTTTSVDSGGATTQPAPGSTSGESEEMFGELSLVFWNWGPSAEELWRGVTDRFTAENPGVTFRLTAVAGDNWGSYLANTATLLAGGAQPDLIFSATEGMKFLADNEIILPIDDLVTGDPEAESLIDDMAPQLVDGMRVDGSLYALPYAWNNMVIYYNTARFEEAGLQPPAPDWTWGDFVDTAQALTEDANGDGNPERYGYIWTGAEFFPSVMPWVLNNDANMVSDDLCTATVNSPDVIEAVQFMHDLIYTHEVAASPSDFGTITNSFINGDVAMFGGGRWPLASLVPEGFLGFDIQLYPQNKAQITEFGVGAFPILQASAQPQLAWEFAKFASSPEMQRANLGEGENPNTDIPALRSVAAELDEMPPPNGSLYYGSIDNGDAALVPAPAQFSEFESTVLRYLGLVWADEMTPEEAMNSAQAELESVVSCS